MKLFRNYRRTNIAQMRPYHEGDDTEGISISDVDRKNGSPKVGDMIARNPSNHEDQWLVAKEYFVENFEAVEENEDTDPIVVAPHVLDKMLILAAHAGYNKGLYDEPHGKCVASALAEYVSNETPCDMENIARIVRQVSIFPVGNQH